MSARLPQVLLRYSDALRDAVGESVQSFREQMPEHSDLADACFDRLLEYSQRPSKRVRGSLAAYVYDVSVDSELEAEGIHAGAAIELMQNYLLIVDDVMDRSVTRRGLPTVHEAYIQDKLADSKREAEMLALLTGLLTQHIAVTTLRESNLPADRVLAASQILQRHIAITEIGQIDDMQYTANRRSVITKEGLLRKYRQKSSYYSFVDPIEVALVLAGKDRAASRASAEAYGIPAGVAFQLRDDWLGIFGDTKATGKPNLDDMREGKYTFMMHEAFKKADATQSAQLEHALGNEDAGETELASVQKILHDTGAETAGLELARAYATEAQAAAHANASWNKQAAEALSELVRFSVERVG